MSILSRKTWEKDKEISKKCCVCGKEFEGTLEYCEDCRRYSWELYLKLPKDRQDALFSERRAEQLQLIIEEWGIQDLNRVVVDYVWLIGVDLKTGVDLMRILQKEANLKPYKARLLVQEILSLYL
ncbi:MAG: hypothetical protein Q7J55_02580 [bacterium]|nr:hypothetical protein [bacterium]